MEMLFIGQLMALLAKLWFDWLIDWLIDWFCHTPDSVWLIQHLWFLELPVPRLEPIIIDFRTIENIVIILVLFPYHNTHDICFPIVRTLLSYQNVLACSLIWAWRLRNAQDTCFCTSNRSFWINMKIWSTPTEVRSTPVRRKELRVMPRSARS